MPWEVRHEGSPKAVGGLTLAQVVEGLRDGRWAVTDEVRGPGEEAWTAVENHPELAAVAAELEPPARPHEDETRLDMNALIDVTLVLLIFFILTTTHATAVQKVIPVPTVSVDPKTGTRVIQDDQVRKYMVRVKAVGDDAGKVAVEVEGQSADVMQADGTVDVDRLAGLLRPHVNGDPPRPEMVLEAKQVSWGAVIAIQDAARAAGVRVVHHAKQRRPK